MNSGIPGINNHPAGPRCAEFEEQAKALMMMHGDLLELIEKHGAEFRGIIDDFARLYARTPTANELVWIASQHAGYNLRNPK